MARRKQGRRPTTADRRRGRQERDAQQIQDLPNREAMSILDGLPMIPGLPPDLLDSGTAAPGSGDPTPVTQPGSETVPADASTTGPINQASIANVGSTGTTEATSSTQEAPITQR
jgi:hypothetical protein